MTNNQQIRVCKRMEFCAAHRLYKYEGECANLHGHNYQVDVIMKSLKSQLDGKSMVIDFKELKGKMSLVCEEYLDHSLILNNDDPLYSVISSSDKVKLKLVTIDGNPTAENIAIWIMEKMLTLTEGYFGATVESVRVYETLTCFAEVQNAV